jgi:hypothetical protein
MTAIVGSPRLMSSPVDVGSPASGAGRGRRTCHRRQATKWVPRPSAQSELHDPDFPDPMLITGFAERTSMMRSPVVKLQGEARA